MRGGIPRRILPGYLDQSREARAGEHTAATLEAIAAHGRFPLEAIYDAAVQVTAHPARKRAPLCCCRRGVNLGGTRPSRGSVEPPAYGHRRPDAHGDLTDGFVLS